MNRPLRPARSEPPIIAIDLPVIYEDDGQEELGDTTWHHDSVGIVTCALRTHFPSQPHRRIYTNLDLYSSCGARSLAADTANRDALISAVVFDGMNDPNRPQTRNRESP